jgi:hypothetical protein
LREGNGTCLHTLPSLVLTDGSWSKIIGDLGVALTGKAECSAPVHALPGQRVGINCLAFGRKDGQRVQLMGFSVVVAKQTGGYVATSGAIPGLGSGTSIVVIAEGP